MARTKTAQGPILSQRDRKRLAAEHKIQQQAEEEQAAAAAEAEEPKQRELFPQEKFLQWLAVFFKTTFTMDRFVQLSILLFAVNQAYVALWETYNNEDDINLLISTACGIVALLAGVVISFRVKSNIQKMTGADYESLLPPWNTVYLIFLPLMLSLVFNRDLLLYNTAFVSSVLDLPFVAKIAIQTSIITSNSQHANILENLQFVLMHLAIHYVLGQISEFKSLDTVEVTLFSTLLMNVYLIKSDALHFVILQRLLVAFGAGMAVVYGIVKVWGTNNAARSLVIVGAWTATFVGLTLRQLNPILGKNAALWLIEYISSSQTRIAIVSVWLGFLVLLIPTIFYNKIELSHNMRRKIWHFVILAIVAYPLHVDPEFVKIALSGALVLFLVVEMIRYLKLSPFGEVLDSNLRTFADFRDEKGPIIISYIYLMIGITLPILFNGSVVGLVALGVGDSLASIIGSNYGEIHWTHSQKTVEGTMTFVVASFLVSSLFKALGWFFQDRSYHALLATATLSGILEGNSDMNDNIMIPGYMAVVLECLV